MLSAVNSAKVMECCQLCFRANGAVGRSLRVYHSLAGNGYGKLSGSLCACGNGNMPAAHV